MKFRLCLLVVSLFAAGATAFAGAVADGNSLFRAGRYDDAILKYGDAQGRNLDPAVVHFNVGDAQYRKKKFDEAASAFERALSAREPLIEAKAQYNIGNCKYRQGKLPEALESYKKVIDLLSGDEEAGPECKKVLADAQANYEFVQNKIKEESKASQPQDKDKNKDKNKDKQDQQQQGGGGQDKNQQKDKGDQKQDQQPESGKDQQKEQAGQDKKDKEQQSKDQQQKDSDKKEKEKQAQGGESKEKKDEKKQDKEQEKAQAQKDKKEGKGEKQDKAQAQAQPAPMSKEEAGRILDSFGQFEDRQKIQDKFNADEPRPVKDW